LRNRGPMIGVLILIQSNTFWPAAGKPSSNPSAQELAQEQVYSGEGVAMEGGVTAGWKTGR
jgi:hypothetical protein